MITFPSWSHMYEEYNLTSVITGLTPVVTVNSTKPLLVVVLITMKRKIFRKMGGWGGGGWVGGGGVGVGGGV